MGAQPAFPHGAPTEPAPNTRRHASSPGSARSHQVRAQAVLGVLTSIEKSRSVSRCNRTGSWSPPSDRTRHAKQPSSPREGDPGAQCRWGRARSGLLAPETAATRTRLRLLIRHESDERLATTLGMFSIDPARARRRVRRRMGQGSANQSPGCPHPFLEHGIDSALPSGSTRPEVLDYLRRESDRRHYLRARPLRTTSPSNRHAREFLWPAVPRQVRRFIRVPVGPRSALVPVHWFSSC